MSGDFFGKFGGFFFFNRIFWEPIKHEFFNFREFFFLAKIWEKKIFFEAKNFFFNNKRIEKKKLFFVF